MTSKSKDTMILSGGTPGNSCLRKRWRNGKSSSVVAQFKNKEQIEELSGALANMREAITEAEALISDYLLCQSDISKMYLAAAVRKHASRIMSLIPAGIFDQQV